MKLKCKLLTLSVILLCVCLVSSTVFGSVTKNWPSGGTALNGVEKITGNTWETVKVIVRILAIAAVVFSGVRYMFAASEERAEIKKGLIYLTIGALIVFGATYIINAIVGATGEIGL